jgi:hypothetical protein
MCSKAVIKHLSCSQLLLCRTFCFLLSLFKIPKRSDKFTDELQRESVSKQVVQRNVRTLVFVLWQ